MGRLDDGALWERGQQGEEASFGLLFERHAAAIHSFCFKRTGDWTLAEDLTSATFLEVWRHRARVRLRAHEVLPYLYGVATNVARNSARSRRRYAAALARMPGESFERDFAEGATERVASEQRVRELLVSLRRLPVGEQEAIALVCWQGLSHSEAAFALNVPEATVRTRLFRARKRLADDDGSEGNRLHAVLQEEGDRQ